MGQRIPSSSHWTTLLETLTCRILTQSNCLDRPCKSAILSSPSKGQQKGSTIYCTTGRLQPRIKTPSRDQESCRWSLHMTGLRPWRGRQQQSNRTPRCTLCKSNFQRSIRRTNLQTTERTLRENRRMEKQIPPKIFRRKLVETHGPSRHRWGTYVENHR